LYELINEASIEHYYTVNKTYPGKIIIFRDGVSDGQLSLVTEYEIPQIYKAFDLISSEYKPLVSMVIVKKRGNARFFAAIDQEIKNPPCGSVIDTVVTRSEW
jgi:aubergine-like protein